MKLVAGGNSLTMLRAGFEYPCGKPPPWHELRPSTPQVPRYAKRELKLASLILVSHIHQGSIKKHLPGRRLLEVPTGLAFMRCLCIGDLYSHAQLSQRSKKKKKTSRTGEHQFKDSHSPLMQGRALVAVDAGVIRRAARRSASVWAIFGCVVRRRRQISQRRNEGKSTLSTGSA